MNKFAKEKPVPVRTFYGLMALIVILILAVCSASLLAEESNSWEGYSSVPMRVNIWHDEEDEIYSKGENIRAHFEVNQEAYVVVYRIDSEGEVTVLWPKSRYDNGFVFADHTYNLPAPGAARLRAGRDNGVEYIEAILSYYPFDLRELQVDFHHESNDVKWDYYVAGDPFLAMNEVNFAVTGLEDPEDFIVTNYTSYYVGREVEHPRYLCSQCHDVNQHHPYRDNCNINVYYDYGWDNDWYATYGYYPAYYYPVYYYVDPWTNRPWVNYWYNPWYRWPSASYAWGWDYYAWNYSPYYNGGVYVRYKTGDRRYRPISKNSRYDKPGADRLSRIPKRMMKDGKPTRDMKDKMQKRVVDNTSAVKRGTKFGYGNTTRGLRSRTTFVKQDRSTVSTPGIRVPSTSESVRGSSTRIRTGNSNLRTGSGVRTGESNTQRHIRSVPQTGRDKKQVVKPVEPRTRGNRIWTGTNNAKQTPKVKPKTSRPKTSVKKHSTPKKSSSSSIGNKKSDSRRKNSTVRSSSSRSSSSRSSGSSSNSKSTSKSSSSKSRTGSKSRR